MQVPLHYTPRKYQDNALRALDNGVTISVWCWARRGGKDLTAFAYAIKKMVEQPMNVVLVYPTKEQGKNAFWNNIENDGFATLDHIPPSLVDRRDNSNLMLTLKNGSTFQILGTTDPDALRGANAKLYIFSEFVDIDSSALDVIRPIIAVNGGQIIIQSTPKIDGISGGTFKILYDRAIKLMPTGKQYASFITAKEYLSDEVLEDLRQETIEKNGNDFKWRQEYLCDWGQASATNYYASIMQELEKRGKIGSFPYVEDKPAYAVWDLGMADTRAITMFQFFNKHPRIIDYFETHNTAYKPTVQYLMSKPYNLAWHFLPHDGSVREIDNRERIDKLQDAGLVNSSLLMREKVDLGINRVLDNLHKAEFNAATTEILRRKLSIYKRKFNGLTGDYLGPEHNTASHAADDIRYMFKAIEDEFDQETGAFLYAPENVQDTYDSNLVSTPNLYRPNY